MKSKKNILVSTIIDQLNKYIGIQISGYLYHDVTGADQLMTNKKGIDIIAHQLELKFDGKVPLFISWTNIAGWSPYSLSVSNTSFCNLSEKFIIENIYWKNLIGQDLEGFKIYGDIEKREPHLLVLEFSLGNKLGIANFYSEKNFVPKNVYGDDVWIIFGTNNLDTCIEVLNLQLL